MGIKLSESNVSDVKKLMDVAAAMANQLLLIMEHNGLAKVPGASVTISVEPGLRFTTEYILLIMFANIIFLKTRNAISNHAAIFAVRFCS